MMSDRRFGNEQALCEAFVRLLESETGIARGVVTYPEVDGSGPPVEMRVCIGGSRYAIEHTLIEPFPNAIQAGQEFVKFTADIAARFNGKMPKPGYYDLIFRIHPTEGRRRGKHADLQKRIAAWIETSALDLQAECPERQGKLRRPHGYVGERSTEFDGMAVTLVRRVNWPDSGTDEGALLLTRVVDEDMEDRRLQRVRSALKKKLPKLLECGGDGDTTVLILEWSDIALTNQILVGNALQKALSDEPAWPSHILLANTAVAGSWHFFRPVENGQFSIDMRYIEICRP